jgi:hypothetical protein
MNTWVRAICVPRPVEVLKARARVFIYLEPRSKSVTDLHSSDIVYFNLILQDRNLHDDSTSVSTIPV